MTFLEEYANKVISGKIIAPKSIIKLYKILLDKLKLPEKYHPWRFDERLANKPIEFIESFCKQAQGKTGEPLLLSLFQKAALQAVFGFVDKNGIRQYNEMLMVIG
jgi:phage terminase large subunit-like protein